MDSNYIIQRLKPYFSEKEGIVAAYLFGSRAGASSGAKPEPDIDIAVLLDETHASGDTLDIKIKLAREIGELLKIDYLGSVNNRGKPNEFGILDIVILNEAPPVLLHEVIKHNLLIFERDRKKRIDFEFYSELKYLDTIPLRKILWEDLVKRIKEGTFGGKRKNTELPKND